MTYGKGYLCISTVTYKYKKTKLICHAVIEEYLLVRRY